MASATPSPQVRVPVGDLVLPPPPPLMLTHYTTGGKIIREGQRTAGGGKIIRRRENFGGVKVMRRRNNYPKWEQVGQKLEKKSENCRTLPKIPYSISLYTEPNYTLS